MTNLQGQVTISGEARKVRFYSKVIDVANKNESGRNGGKEVELGRNI